MIILRQKEYFFDKENPSKLSQAISPATRSRANSVRWKEFNKDTGGSRWRLNVGDTKKDFQNWQKEKYGNVIGVGK